MTVERTCSGSLAIFSMVIGLTLCASGSLLTISGADAPSVAYVNPEVSIL